MCPTKYGKDVPVSGILRMALCMLESGNELRPYLMIP